MWVWWTLLACRFVPDAGAWTVVSTLGTDGCQGSLSADGTDWRVDVTGKDLIRIEPVDGLAWSCVLDDQAFACADLGHTVDVRGDGTEVVTTTRTLSGAFSSTSTFDASETGEVTCQGDRCQDDPRGLPCDVKWSVAGVGP